MVDSEKFKHFTPGERHTLMEALALAVERWVGLAAVQVPGSDGEKYYLARKLAAALLGAELCEYCMSLAGEVEERD